MSNSRYDDDSFEDELINEFGDKDEDESLSELESELRPKEENLGMQAPEEEYIFDDSYEETKPKKKKKSTKTYSTKTILVIGFIIILLCIVIDATLIGYKLIYKETIDIKPLLVYQEKSVIYDNTTINKKMNDHIPIININNSSINDINNEINKIYNNYLNSNPDYFRYDYKVNEDILSLVLIYRNKLDKENNYTYKFKTYNISLKTLLLYDDNLILAKYKLNLSDVNKKMREDFQKTYDDLLRKNYIDETYNYNRLITDLELTNFTSDINYYIDNNKLYVYRSFNIYNNKNITSYFNESNYRFYIK